MVENYTTHIHKKKKAKEIARMINKQSGSVWINKIMIERIEFK